MASTVLPVPARPSRATTSIAGSSSNSRAKRCSLEHARGPHASGALREQRDDRGLRDGRVPTAIRSQHGKLVLDEGVDAVDVEGVDRAASYSRSIVLLPTSKDAQPTVVSRSRRAVLRCSTAMIPRCAALIRRAASFDTTSSSALARPDRGRRR